MSSKHSQVALIGLAAAVIVGVAVLVIMLRTGAKDELPRVAKPAAARPEAPPVAPTAVVAPEGRRGAPRPTVTRSTTSKHGEPEFRTSVSPEGAVVRDHRAEGAPEVTAPMHVPVTAGNMKAKTIASVRDALRPLVRKCEADHAPEVDGDRPRLQAMIRVTVEGDRVIAGENKVTVTHAKADALVDCVKNAAKDIDIPAKGHPEITNYALTFPFRLARKPAP